MNDVKTKSELLKESIIDATELKKTALKNAEQLLIKNYAPVIEEYVEKILQEGTDEDKDLLFDQNEANNMPPLGNTSAAPQPDMDIGAETPTLPGMEDGMGNDLGMDGDLDDPGTGEEEKQELTEPEQNTVEQLPLASEGDDIGTQKITLSLGAVSNSGKDETNQSPIAPEENNDNAVVPLEYSSLGEDMPEETLQENENLVDDKNKKEVQKNIKTAGSTAEKPKNSKEELDDEEDYNLEEIRKALEEAVDIDFADSHQGSLHTNKEEAKNSCAKNKMKEEVLGEAEEGDVNEEPDVTKVGNKEDENSDHSLIIKEAVNIALKESVKYFNAKMSVLAEENKILLKKNTIYIQKLNELKEVLQKSNLLNTRLYYKNKVLQDPSLNERQKEEIVEAISKANNREKVQTIYEVRKTFLGYTPVRQEKSLEKLLESKNYLQTFVAKSNSEEDEIEKRIKERLQILSGIKKDID